MKRHWRAGWFAVATVCLLSRLATAQAGASPNFAPVDNVINAAVAAGTIPGAVVIIGHDHHIVYRKAYGMRSLEPVREPMTVNTIFDLASLTKCIATTTSVMKLVEQGRIRLNDTVATYLPEFAKNGKADITIRQLLTHYSGLREDLDLKSDWHGRDAAFRMAMDETPIYSPGSRFLYSDINFETLGFIVEKVSGEPLDVFAREQVFTPLGMKDTRFNPPADWRPRIAPTEYDEHQVMLRGTVHDPTARRMDGVAGHAGLFSTADDLALFAEDLLSGSHVLSAQSVEKMSTPEQPPTAIAARGLGWDIDSPFSSNRGEFLPVGSFGHTGFTGTSLWIDPVTDSYIILLTNAVHLRGGHSTVSLRARVANAVTQVLKLTPDESARLRMTRITGYNEAMAGARLISARNGRVHTGIDVEETRGFADLHIPGKATTRIALVTNTTGRDAQGRRTIDVLAHAPGVELAVIFTPEHGVTSTLDTTAITDSRDAATRVAISSVYGATEAERRPKPELMRSVDLVVYDIQDIGTRFYTYETTLGYFLEAAAAASKPIVVLDRPNPVNGSYIQGPSSDTGRESFINYTQIPVRHGLTIGELARFFNGQRDIHADLRVVAMEGWQRGDWLDSTGLTWVNPSPNMRSLDAAILYPGVGMLEATNISVGRGTDTPFELLGAPWVNGSELARTLNERDIEGVRFLPLEFIPGADKYSGQHCGGVRILLINRNTLDSPELGLEIASALHQLYPTQFDMTAIDHLMLNAASAKALLYNEDPRRIAQDWIDADERFRQLSRQYLLY